MEDLIKALNSPEEVDRIYAAQDIAETKDPAHAVHLLERLSVEKSQAVNDAVVFALKNLPCSGNYDMLFKLFRSPEPYLRNAAIGIFGSEKEEAVPFLSSHLNHADGEVRKLILDALFATGDPGIIGVIRQSLHDPSVNVRITAAEYLGRIEDRDSVNELIGLFQKESEPMLRIAVLDSLLLIGEFSDIMNLFSIISPKGDFKQTDPLYLPQIINLAAKTGDAAIICKVLDAIPDIGIYSEDIIHALDQAERKFKGLCRHADILDIIKKIIEKTTDKELHALCRELIGLNS
jgi:HEAT repeat protein